MSRKQEFITAACWMWGISKKAAQEFYNDWRRNNPAIIDNVIESFQENAWRSAYTD